MAKKHIIKAKDVKFEGRFQLEIREIKSTQSKEETAEQGEAQVKIAESHSDFAIIEITCGCGTSTQVRCNFPAPQPVGQESDQKEAIGENNNEG